MSTLLLERSPALDEGFERDAHRRLDDALFAGTADAHGKLTLDDLITGAWEGLVVRGAVTCPVCASPMAARSSEDGGQAPTGICVSCGSQLS
jgi:hypothetical protein